jgi:signal transduction histidine kinase
MGWRATTFVDVSEPSAESADSGESHPSSAGGAFSGRNESSMLATRPGAVKHLMGVGLLRVALRLVMPLTDVPVAIVGFVHAVTGIALSVGLMPLFLLGLPLFTWVGAIARAKARFERKRMRLFLDIEIPEPPNRPHGVAATLKDGPTWRALAYSLLQLPLAVVTFVASFGAWGVSLALVTLPAWLNHVPARHANLWLLSVGDETSWSVAFVVGLLFAVVALAVTFGLTTIEGALAKAMLGVTAADLARRVGQLEGSRARVVDAAEAERRRIERDLHDGAQQRLVALAMNLGRARARYEDDPEGARKLLDEAHVDAKHALVELRDLARGLHPAVLTDRGLDAALSGLAARSPVPVTLDVDVLPRCAPTIEAIAYFVVSEALANVAKHSRAQRVDVVARRVDDRLHVTITDDGVGGALIYKGGGLAGLTDRAGGVDGTLRLDSPAGGPTVLRLELPCES